MQTRTPDPNRLQPIEIHPDLVKVLEAWESFASDNSLLETMRRDGKELGPLSKALEQAQIAWSVSYILDELARRPAIMDKLREPPSDIPYDEYFFVRSDVLTSNSIVYRTFVSVVLGRTEEFVGALGEIGKRNPSNHFSATMKLLRNDEIRYLRNAIGHGTFLAKGQVLQYEDKGRKRRISFRELDQINSAIWAILLSAMAASYAWSRN